MKDDLVHGHDLLPPLLHCVVVLPQDNLPVPGLLPPVEAVASREDPLVSQQGTATSVLP